MDVGGLVVSSRHRLDVGEVVSPASLAEATEAIEAGGVPIAGGFDLMEDLKAGRGVHRLVVLRNVAELKSVARVGTRVVIGATATHRDLVRSKAFSDSAPELARIWATVASPRIRAQGTVVGNIVAARSEYDGPAAFAAVGGVLATARGEHAVPDEVPESQLVTHLAVEVDGLLWVGAERSLRPGLSTWLALRVASDSEVLLSIAVATSCRRPIVVHERLPMNAVHSHVDLSTSLGDGLARFLERLPKMPADSSMSADYRDSVVRVQIRRLVAQFAACGDQVMRR